MIKHQIPRPSTVSLGVIRRQRQRIAFLERRMAEAWRVISAEEIDAAALAELAELLAPRAVSRHPER